MPSRCNSDQRAGDIARKIAKGGVDEESLEFLTGKGRFQETVHGEIPAVSKVHRASASARNYYSNGRPQPARVARSRARRCLCTADGRLASVTTLTVLCWHVVRGACGPGRF